VEKICAIAHGMRCNKLIRLCEGKNLKKGFGMGNQQLLNEKPPELRAFVQ
jgi:hypothetical protein